MEPCLDLDILVDLDVGGLHSKESFFFLLLAEVFWHHDVTDDVDIDTTDSEELFEINAPNCC